MDNRSALTQKPKSAAVDLVTRYEADEPRVMLSDTGRAEAFSDAVFAIIITLLVLDLRVPEIAAGRLLVGLLDQWPTYLAYVTSYLYVGVVWLNHKAVFTRIRAMDSGLHWANLGVLFTTALLPFPTAVMANAIEVSHPEDERTAVGLYSMIGTLLCVSWLVFFHYLSRHPELIEEHVSPGFFSGERIRAGIGVVLYAAGGLLGYLITPALALLIFLALPIFYAVTSHRLLQVPIGVPRARPRKREGA